MGIEDELEGVDDLELLGGEKDEEEDESVESGLWGGESEGEDVDVAWMKKDRVNDPGEDAM